MFPHVRKKKKFEIAGRQPRQIRGTAAFLGSVRDFYTFKVPMLRDVKFLRATFARGSTKCTIAQKKKKCGIFPPPCRSPRKSRSAPRRFANGKQCCSRTATGRWIAALWRGKSHIRGFFTRRPPTKSPFFRTKCLRGDVTVSFREGGRCHIAARMLDFYAKSRVGAKS